VGIGPVQSQSKASTVLLSPQRSIRNSGCTAHSLSKLESRLYDVIGGPLVFEIWRLPGGALVTLFFSMATVCLYECYYC